MRSLTLVLLPALVLIAGCDKRSDPAEQATRMIENAGAPVNAADTSPDEATAPAPAAPAGAPDHSHKGAAAPTAAFEMPEGGTLTLAAFAGKPFLLNLWATWCGPCKVEMPALDKVAGEGRLAVVTVSQDLDGANVVRPYFAKAGFKALKTYTDPSTNLSQALGNPSLPTTILYDAHGREVWRVTGGMDWTGAAAKKLLAEAR